MTVFEDKAFKKVSKVNLGHTGELYKRKRHQEPPPQNTHTHPTYE
jgi:hypothetical protein